MILLRKSIFIVVLLIFISSFFNIVYCQSDLNVLSNKISTPIKLEARIDVPLELNLQKALEIAVLQNLDVAQGRFQKNIDKWKLVENIGNFLPDYRLGFSDQRFDGSFLIGGIFPVMTLTSSVNAFMRFDYRFFEGGKGFFNTLAAKNIYKSSNENLSLLLGDTLLAVTQAYNNLLREQAQLDVLEKSVDEAQSELELNQNLEKEGVGTKFNVLQSEAQLAEQEQAYILQQAKFRDASIHLARLLSLEQGVHIKPDKNDLTPKKLFNTDIPIGEIISTAIKNRPDLRKIQLVYNASKNYIGVAFSDFLPRANFFGQYGGTGNVIFHRTKVRGVIPDAIALDESENPLPMMVSRDRLMYQTFEPQVDLSNITNVSNVVKGAGRPFTTTLDDSLMSNRFLGIEVGWDVADGLGVPSISRINQARYQAKSAKLNIDKLIQRIEQEVRSVFLNVQAQEQLIDVANKRVKAATEALRLAKLRLENGIGINTELLNAQKQYSGALASQVNAIVEYNNAEAELLHALGLISIEKLLGKN